nr:uncharacterized protein LOC104097863 isoform X1 [Nicotiana tomentosiformis]
MSLIRLLKRVEIQHQVSCICTSIHMAMMENLLLLRNPESYMKNITRYYNNKHKLNLILISVKHIIKTREEKRKEEYMILDLKQNATTGHIVPVIVERVCELVSLPSHQPNTDLTNHTLDVAPIVPTSSTATNIDEVHALGSDDDRNPPASHS